MRRGGDIQRPVTERHAAAASFGDERVQCRQGLGFGEGDRAHPILGAPGDGGKAILRGKVADAPLGVQARS